MASKTTTLFLAPLTASSHVVVQVTCASCHRPAELECRGLSGYLAYPAYNEFFCPSCRKQNHARTPGGIVSVRAAEFDTEARTAAVPVAWIGRPGRRA